MPTTPEDQIRRELLAVMALERRRLQSSALFNELMQEALDTLILRVQEPITPKIRREILAELKEILNTAYAQIPSVLAEDQLKSATIAYNNSSNAIETLPSAIEAGLSAKLVTDATREQLTTLLNPNRQLGTTGFTINDLLTDMKDETVRKTRTILSKGIVDALSPSETVRELKTLYTDTTKSRAETIYRTAVMDAADVGRQSAYKQFNSVIQGYMSMAVLDSRTSPICIELHLAKYIKKSGETISQLYDRIPNKPRRHLNCRSILMPLTNDTLEILDDISRPIVFWEGRKSVVVGMAKGNANFSDVVNTMSTKQLETLAGSKTKASLLKSGKLTFSDIIKKQRKGSYKFLTDDEVEGLLK